METRVRTASVSLFYDEPPTTSSESERTWVARAANFVVTWTRARAGTCLRRAEQPDEYFVFSPDTALSVATRDARIDARMPSVTIVPAWQAAEITLHAEGSVMMVFTNRSQELAGQARNAAEYAMPDARVAPLLPCGGVRSAGPLRNHPLPVQGVQGSRMRIFRTEHLMMNFLLPRNEPRDVRNVTPHSHGDFEQGSFAVQGDWVHHLRYPWTKNMDEWREDEHVAVASPSLLVIPPQVIHTSRNTNEGGAWLIDLFAPPRIDFLDKGWVINSQDYSPHADD